MADNKNDKPRTHTAWAIQQQRVKRLVYTRVLEVGEGRIDENGAHLFLDRLPLGGFSGYVKLLPKGVAPSPPPPTPSRPDEADDDAEEI
jgi:hypothetical protein